MQYVSSDGSVGGRPNSGIVAMFWSVVEFFRLFFFTLVMADVQPKFGRGSSSSSRRGPGGGPGPGGPRRRVGRLSDFGAPSAPPFSGGG